MEGRPGDVDTYWQDTLDALARYPACPELDVHLVGAVDQAGGQRMPFRIMLQMLRAVAST